MNRLRRQPQNRAGKALGREYYPNLNATNFRTIPAKVLLGLILFAVSSFLMGNKRTLNLMDVLEIRNEWPINPTTDICKNAAISFQKNSLTAIGLLAVPGVSALLSWDLAYAKEQAISEVGQPLEQTDPEGEVFLRHLKQIARTQSPLFHNRVVFFTGQLDKVVPNLTPQSHSFYEGILHSVIVLSWTAFEEMVRTIWKSLRDSPNTTFRRPTDKEISKLRLGLGSRSKIRRTYDFSFGSSEINDCLSEDQIDPLAILRNVIVHNASRANEDFLQDISKFPQLANFHSLGDGDPVNLEGGLVKLVVETTLGAGYQLIEKIDEWINLNP